MQSRAALMAPLRLLRAQTDPALLKLHAQQTLRPASLPKQRRGWDVTADLGKLTVQEKSLTAGPDASAPRGQQALLRYERYCRLVTMAEAEQLEARTKGKVTRWRVTERERASLWYRPCSASRGLAGMCSISDGGCVTGSAPEELLGAGTRGFEQPSLKACKISGDERAGPRWGGPVPLSARTSSSRCWRVERYRLYI